MKKIAITLVFSLAAFIGSVSNVSAVPIGTTGGADSLVGSTTLPNSGEATEEAWIELVLGMGIDYSQLPSSGGGDGAWEAVTGGDPDLVAFDFSSFGVTAPTHFLVKTGGGVTVDSHFLFSNGDSTNWGVIDLGDFDLESGKQISISTLSHVGAVGGGETVPEPSSLVMLAVGLGLLPFARRRA